MCNDTLLVDHGVIFVLCDDASGIPQEEGG
jgi:hypothetical protein